MQISLEYLTRKFYRTKIGKRIGSIGATVVENYLEARVASDERHSIEFFKLISGLMPWNTDLSKYLKPYSDHFDLDYALILTDDFDYGDLAQHTIIREMQTRKKSYFMSLCQKDNKNNLYELAVIGFYFEAPMTLTISQIQGANFNRIKFPIDPELPKDWVQMLYEITLKWASNHGIETVKVTAAEDIDSYVNPSGVQINELPALRSRMRRIYDTIPGNLGAEPVDNYHVFYLIKGRHHELPNQTSQLISPVRTPN